MAKYTFKIEVITEHNVEVEAEDLLEAARVISNNKKTGNTTFSDGTTVVRNPVNKTRVWCNGVHFRNGKKEIKHLLRHIVRGGNRVAMGVRVYTNEQIKELDL